MYVRDEGSLQINKNPAECIFEGIMTRRELREHIFREVFTSQFYSQNDEECQQQLDLYFTHAGGDDLEFPPDEVEEEQREEILQKAQDVLSHVEEIDKVIDETSVGWTVERMNRTDLAVLRLGVYELLFDESIPAGVAINEAVLLARKFGGEDSYSFVNGILGKIQKVNNAE